MPRGTYPTELPTTLNDGALSQHGREPWGSSSTSCRLMGYCPLWSTPYARGKGRPAATIRSGRPVSCPGKSQDRRRTRKAPSR